MSAIQTTYGTGLATAYVGMIANAEECNLISREVETAAIPFGAAAKQGVAETGILAATAAADVFRGIVLRDQSADARVAINSAPVLSSALVMTQGIVWVRAGATVAPGTAVYMVVGTAQAGNFTSVPTSNLPIPRATFESSGVVGDLVKIRLV